MKLNRTILLYENWFIDWYHVQDKKVQEKIDWVLEMVKIVPVIPQQYFRHLENTDGLYEIRVAYENNVYRIFCFFDAGNLVILINAFHKKTQKTPRREMIRATRLKQQYFEDKRSHRL